MKQSSESFDIMYTGSSEITLESWEKIIHALITYGERIWLHTSVSISKHIPSELRRLISHTFDELKEDRLICTWDYEYSNNPSGYHLKTLHNEDIKTLYSNVNYQIENYSAMGTLSGQELEGAEVTSKIIQYRHELWNIGLASLLDISSICYDKSPTRMKGNYSSYYKYEIINKQYTENIFEQLEMPPLGFLSCKDIKEIRGKSEALRARLAEPINSKMIEMPPCEDSIKTECDDIILELNSLITELAKDKSLKYLGKDITKESVIASLSVLMPSFALYTFADKMMLWLKGNRKYSFLFFALETKNRAFEKYSKAIKAGSAEIYYKR